jgi:hypothetical protein
MIIGIDGGKKENKERGVYLSCLSVYTFSVYHIVSMTGQDQGQKLQGFLCSSDQCVALARERKPGVLTSSNS